MERKAITNLDSILKSRDITLPKKVHIVKAMVFPVVMYECESWTMKKAEHGTTDWFQIRKGVHQGCILSPCLFNLYAEYIMRNAGLDEINTSGRNINNLKIGSYYHSNGRK